MSRTKTDEPIEMSFRLWTRVGSGNHVLGGGPDPPRGKCNFRGMSQPIVKYKAYPVCC